MYFKNKLLLSVFNLKLTTVNLSQAKPITTDTKLTSKGNPTVIQNKPKSLFPKPAEGATKQPETLFIYSK